MCLRSTIKNLCYFVIVLGITLNTTQAALQKLEAHEETLYQQGIKYRNERLFQNAMECFEPLANRKYVKAEHNLAMCYFKLGNELEAAQWFREAANQGFAPSINNLNKMNILCLLLSNEDLGHITKFLNMRSLLNFMMTSQRLYRVGQSELTRVNFLTSNFAYAHAILSYFSHVNFEPKPTAIRIQKRLNTKNGDIEIRFRDTEHLRSIVEIIPDIKVSDERRRYFVHDQNVQDGMEVVSLNGKIISEYFIRILADQPLRVSGHIKDHFPLPMNLPVRSDMNSLQMRGKSYSCGNLKSYEEAHHLADILDETFNKELLEIRTKEAYQLVETRKEHRLSFPHLYPALHEICPDAIIIMFRSEIKIIQRDDLRADTPLFYIAPSHAVLQELLKTLPECFSNSICYIDPYSSQSGSSQSGVYCKGPLSIMKGFEIRSEGDLALSGQMSLPEHNIALNIEGYICGLGISLNVGGSISIKGESISLSPIFNIKEHNEKPNNMPLEDWNFFIEYLFRNR